MAGGRIGVGYLAVPIGIRIWHRIGTRVGIHPVAAWARDINVGIVAPAVAVILEDVPAWSIGKEPSLVPVRVIDISGIISIEHAVRIPLIEPGIACSRGLQP